MEIEAAACESGRFCYVCTPDYGMPGTDEGLGWELERKVKKEGGENPECVPIV